MLLLLLGAGAAVGSFFPQRPIDRRAVEAWIDRNPGAEGVMEAFGLFDVYGSWWFMIIYVLLLVSLVGCLTRRYRAQLRLVRQQPRTPSELAARERYMRATVQASPEQVLTEAGRVLRKRRFRRRIEGSTLSAEKGHLRESGSLLFHTSILVLLAGATIARMFGASGQVLLMEGDTFIDSYLGYDSLTAGRAFGSGHTGFELELQEFDVQWHPSGVPRLYESRVIVTEPSGESREATVRVNEPLQVAGRDVYQIAWGWAPVLEVRQQGEVLYSGPTVFLPEDNGWIGVAKIPQTEPEQTGLAMQLVVDPQEGPDGELFDRNREPRDPLVIAQILRGDLGLDKPQNVYRLETDGLERIGQELVGLGRETAIGDGITLAFTDMIQYSVFQVGYNPGSPLLLLGAVGLVVGVVPGLYAFRRRIWVRATSSDRGTLIEFAGHSFQRKDAADQEFKALVAELDRTISRTGSAARSEEHLSHDRSPAS